MITLGNGFMEAEVLTYGATLRSLRLHLGDGDIDVVLGYDTLAEYENSRGRLGATIGRIAGRTSCDPFEFDGRSYALPESGGGVHIHGGRSGFDKKVWHIESATDDSVVLSNVSPDGEEGYPGGVTTYATFRLYGAALEIKYVYRAAEPTVAAVTNHQYFNLRGGSGKVDDYSVRILSDRYLETDGDLIPTGRILQIPPERSFRKGRSFGTEKLDMTVVFPVSDTVRPIAEVRCTDPDVVMTVGSSCPAMQLYTQDKLTERVGKDNAEYGPRSGFCMEMMHYPDTLHHPDFPPVTVMPGRERSDTTVISFAPMGT